MTRRVVPPLADPVLAQFRAASEAMYGGEIERVVLFGSRARGDAGDNSDYDVAVFLKHLPDRWRELARLADLRVKFIDDFGLFFEVLPYPAGSYSERSPLYKGNPQRRPRILSSEAARFLDKAWTLLDEADATLCQCCRRAAAASLH